MRDSALKRGEQRFQVHLVDGVGEELMRDSALKPKTRRRSGRASTRSEKSSCATAL